MWGLEGFNGKKAREPLMAKSRLPNNRADGSSSPQARWYPLNTDRWSSPGADDSPLHQAWSTLPTWSPLNSTQPSTLPTWSPLNSTQPSTLPRWGPPDAALERMMSSAPSSHWVVCSGTPVADDFASETSPFFAYCVYTPFSPWSGGEGRKLIDWCTFLIVSTMPLSHPLVEAACFLPCAQWVFTSRSCCCHFETDPEWVISLILTNDCTVLWWLDKNNSTSQFHNASFYSLTVLWGLFN